MTSAGALFGVGAAEEPVGGVEATEKAIEIVLVVTPSCAVQQWLLFQECLLQRLRQRLHLYLLSLPQPLEQSLFLLAIPQNN